MGGLFGPPHKKTHSLWNGHLARSGLFGHWCQLKLSARPPVSPPVRQGMNSLSDCRAIGLSDCRAIGLSDYRTIGLSDCRTVGLSDCRTVGLSECRTIGLSDYRNVGLSDYRSTD